MKPPTFEEAAQHITDPNYGLGIPWLWQLPDSWPGSCAAKIHDLRYDYLKPGEDTEKIDYDCRDHCLAEGCSATQVDVFFKLMRIWGEAFQLGKDICWMLGDHNWKPCSYGQAGMIYDLRCSRCGLHKDV